MKIYIHVLLYSVLLMCSRFENENTAVILAH